MNEEKQAAFKSYLVQINDVIDEYSTIAITNGFPAYSVYKRGRHWYIGCDDSRKWSIPDMYENAIASMEYFGFNYIDREAAINLISKLYLISKHMHEEFGMSDYEKILWVKQFFSTVTNEALNDRNLLEDLLADPVNGRTVTDWALKNWDVYGFGEDYGEEK